MFSSELVQSVVCPLSSLLSALSKLCVTFSKLQRMWIILVSANVCLSPQKAKKTLLFMNKSGQKLSYP